MPSSKHIVIISRTDLIPSRCPAMRGRLRASAHRPFPSIMMAKCLGRRSESSFAVSSVSDKWSSLEGVCVSVSADSVESLSHEGCTAGGRKSTNGPDESQTIFTKIARKSGELQALRLRLEKWMGYTCALADM